jgi:hypothetical protein
MASVSAKTTPPVEPVSMASVGRRAYFLHLTLTLSSLHASRLGSGLIVSRVEIVYPELLEGAP